MQKRSRFLAALAGVVAVFRSARPAPAVADATSAPAVLHPNSNPEYKPFIDIANRKGKQITFYSVKVNKAAPDVIHLDMDMVRASLDNAIERSKKEDITWLTPRLEYLRSHGTGAQQVDFVLGSGNRYFFPQDVEKLVALSENPVTAKSDCPLICRLFCWLACICTGDARQECTERCREVCSPKC